MEDALIDTEDAAFDRVRSAFEALSQTDDWISPKLAQYLVALRQAASLPQLPYRTEARTLPHLENELTFLERQTVTPYAFWVSNTTAMRVPILEESLGSPGENESVSGAFADRLRQLKDNLNLSRLCFIEKEMGPVGALSMMSSLVASTGLPACIYRETHWTNALSLAADRPRPGDRVAIVYDLVVTGAGITGAADILKELTGASTVAALVLCGYGPKRSELISPKGQRINLTAFDWHTDVHGPVFEREALEAKETVRPAHKSPDRKKMPQKTDRKEIPPGSYNRQNLPTISSSAQSIVDRIYATLTAKDPKNLGATRQSSLGLKIKDKAVDALRLKSPLKPKN